MATFCHYNFLEPFKYLLIKDSGEDDMVKIERSVDYDWPLLQYGLTAIITCALQNTEIKQTKNTLLIIFNTRGTSGHATEPSTADDTLANLYFTTPGNYAKYCYTVLRGSNFINIHSWRFTMYII